MVDIQTYTEWDTVNHCNRTAKQGTLIWCSSKGLQTRWAQKLCSDMWLLTCGVCRLLCADTKTEARGWAPFLEGPVRSSALALAHELCQHLLILMNQSSILAHQTVSCHLPFRCPLWWSQALRGRECHDKKRSREIADRMNYTNTTPWWATSH